MKHWEIIADNLKKAGWNCGFISSTDHDGRQFWIVAAEHDAAGRFIVRADQELLAFLEIESAIQTDRDNHSAIGRNRMKNWEIIADNPSKAGWNLELSLSD